MQNEAGKRRNLWASFDKISGTSLAVVAAATCIVAWIGLVLQFTGSLAIERFGSALLALGGIVFCEAILWGVIHLAVKWGPKT